MRTPLILVGAVALVAVGTLPSVEDAQARLDQLTGLGPTPGAFTFKERFPPPLADDVEASEAIA